MPPGLLILVDDVEAGRSPLGPVWLPAKTVRVRAQPDDPRRFDTASDEVQVSIQAGSTARVFLDLRPGIVLRSVPEPATIFRLRTSGGDSLLGETPLVLSPARLEGGFFRFHASEHADTVLSGESLVGMAGAGSPEISLRRVVQPAAPAPARTPLFRKRWFQWTLVGAGAGLTGAAAVLRREADRWYDRYLESSDRRVLDRYFDRAVRYDRFALISLGVGQLFFTGGLVLLVSGSSP